MSDPRPGWLYDPSDPNEYEKGFIEEVKRQNAFAEALGVSPQQLINEINAHALRNT